MPQNIQNFSDLSDINTQSQLSIDLVVQRHGAIDCDVWLNDQLILDNEYEVQLDLLDHIQLKCRVRSFAEGYSGLEIVKFTINGLKVLPLYQHLSSDGTCYLDRVGDWHLHIPSPFYTWYHTITGQGWIA